MPQSVTLPLFKQLTQSACSTNCQSTCGSERVWKFVGDNVDKKRGIRDIRTDCHGEMKHKFSILAVRSRVPSHLAHSGPELDLADLSPSMVLPTAQDIQEIQNSLVILVNCILCRYMKCLSSFSSLVPGHIPHEHSKEMACKSEVAVLDVLSKNEATPVTCWT